MRIAFKRQRYSAETLINLMGKRAPEDPLAADLDDATTAARSAKVMQQQLGIVHDIDQAMLTLRAAEAIDMTARQRTASALSELRQTLPHRATASISGRRAPTPPDDEVAPARSPG